MSTDYRIEPFQNKFIVIDPWHEQVGLYPNEEAAQQDIERCKREDGLFDHAKVLVDLSIDTLMHVHGVTREEAAYWLRSAAEVVE